ncbi:Uncharacterised protein [Vibrio cholerae]|nr:Uncharacterised protein [Vibrio cholerae]
MVSRWLVIPMAATSSLRMPALPSASTNVELCVA